MGYCPVGNRLLGVDIDGLVLALTGGDVDDIVGALTGAFVGFKLCMCEGALDDEYVGLRELDV